MVDAFTTFICREYDSKCPENHGENQVDHDMEELVYERFLDEMWIVPNPFTTGFFI